MLKVEQTVVFKSRMFPSATLRASLIRAVH